MKTGARLAHREETMLRDFMKLAVCLAAFLLFGMTAAHASHGPRSAAVSAEDYGRVYYVSATSGSDTRGRGSKSRPWASIGKALSAAAGASPGVAVFVAAGRYEEHSLELPREVHLYGGFDPGNWEQRDVWAQRTVIDGGRSGRVFAAADGARLDGFEVTGGQVRGAGGAVLIDGTAPVLANNFFTDNRTLGPSDWAPQYLPYTAHDGGAVYCTNGGAPRIVNNVFHGNRTENGRGAAIAYDGHCDGEITGNVLLGNRAGSNDPMRSSDGGAISVFRWSSPLIENNVVLGNAALNKNDGGGIFVALWSSPAVRGNLVVGNEAGDDAGGLFVGGQEHRYDAPLDPLPPAEDFFVEIVGNRFFGNRNPSGNSGATRITMESRGRVAGNVAALNPGFYIQRSELEVRHNTILEDTLLVETKEGLAPSTFERNIVFGSFKLDTEAAVRASLFRDGFPGEGNVRGTPVFVDDGMDLRVVVATWSRRDFRSILQVTGASGDLAGRVVVSGGRWGVVDEYADGRLSVWGDFSAVTRLTVLPTYRQASSSPGTGMGADAVGDSDSAAWQPKRVNKTIELLESGQPVYYQGGYGGYADGLEMARTWADYIVYNMEHNPLDFTLLRDFMRGLVDGGPTPSGHRTPTVIVVLPLLGLDDDAVKDAGWMVQQALAQGVHGVHLARARDPDAVRRFVQAARYSIHDRAVDEVGEGLRGWGSQMFAAWVWGLDPREYLLKADVWPLNPEGEVMLGIKLEDRQALAMAEETIGIPGLAFVEHGPRDLGLSYGYLEGRADPPVPPEVSAAGDRILNLARRNGLFFLDNVLPDNVEEQVDRGVMIGAGSVREAAEVGRRHTNRRMPW